MSSGEPTTTPIEATDSSWAPGLLIFGPVLVTVAGILLLMAGGLAAGLGAWLLATGLPISLGAAGRDPRLALWPLIVWGGWYLSGSTFFPTAEIPHTPFPLALTLGLISAGATLLAQRAIFPATEKAAWATPPGRRAPSIDAALDTSLDAEPETAGVEADEVVAETIELTPEDPEFGELAPEQLATADEDAVATDAEAEAGDVEDDATEDENDDVEVEAEVEENEDDDEADAEDEAELVAVAVEDLSEADLEDEPTDAGAQEQAAPLPAATRAGRRKKT